MRTVTDDGSWKPADNKKKKKHDSAGARIFFTVRTRAPLEHEFEHGLGVVGVFKHIL